MGLERDEHVDFNTLTELVNASAAVGDSIRKKEEGIAEGVITRLVANVQTYNVSPHSHPHPSPYPCWQPRSPTHAFLAHSFPYLPPLPAPAPVLSSQLVLPVLLGTHSQLSL